MSKDLSRYLGTPVSSLLNDTPFKDWTFEQYTEDELKEPRIYYSSQKNGLDVGCDIDEKIRSIFLHSDRFDDSLSEIPFSLSREQVVSLLGTPSKSTEKHTDPVLGDYGASDRFTRTGFSIHIEYKNDTDGIKMITLMRSDVVPG